MSAARFLTAEEATLLSYAAERWLRLRDVELNPGEYVHELLSSATLRSSKCTRQDIASINWTMEVQLSGCSAPKEMTLVSPGDADIALGRVSVLTLIGLNFVGRVVGSVAQIPSAQGPSQAATLLAARRCTALERSRRPARIEPAKPLY
ncbi:MAG: hypothetical protein V4455_15810 [Pseudomonadota bacterium]